MQCNLQVLMIDLSTWTRLPAALGKVPGEAARHAICAHCQCKAWLWWTSIKQTHLCNGAQARATDMLAFQCVATSQHILVLDIYQMCQHTWNTKNAVLLQTKVTTSIQCWFEKQQLAKSVSTATVTKQQHSWLSHSNRL